MPTTSLADTAYLILRSRITSLEIPPGSGFTAGEIASELGLSKTPVREALTRLRFEGLVLVDQKVGYRASAVTIKDTHEFFALRTLLEGEAACLAATQAVDEKQLRTLDELCSSNYAPDDAASVDRFLAANTSFHIMIGRAAGNEHLTRMLEILLVQMERLFRIGLLLSSGAEPIVHEHQDLVEAIMSGDGRLARQVAVAQIHASQRMVLEALISSSEVTTTPIGMPSLNEARNGDI